MLRPFHGLEAECALFAFAICAACVPAREDPATDPPPNAPATVVARSRPEAVSSLYFEPNQGQLDPRVSFYARAPGYTLFMAGHEVVYSMPAAEAGKRQVVRMSFGSRGAEAGDADPVVHGEALFSGVSHYYPGKDPSSWRLFVPHYGAFRAAQIEAGIDLVYRAERQHLEYDLIVHPGADPSAIQLAFEGADRIQLDRQGNLLTRVGDRTLVQGVPHIYQETAGVRTDVGGHYVLADDGQHVGFAIDRWDRSAELVIDPTTMVYGSFLGGTGPSDNLFLFLPTEEVSHIAADAQGRAYVAGVTDAVNFPTTAGSFQPVSPTIPNAFAARVSVDGSTLEWSTFLGGAARDEASGLSVDPAGNAVLAGNTGTLDFPLVNPQWDASDFDGAQAFGITFLLRFAGDGTVSFSTLFCASLSSMAIDPANGDIWLTGFAAADDPATHDVREGCFPARPSAAAPDLSGGFISHLGPDGSNVGSKIRSGAGRLKFGGDGALYLLDGAQIQKLDGLEPSWTRTFNLQASINDFAVDKNGSVYFTGSTTSPNLPVTRGAFQTTYAGTRPDFRLGSSTAEIGDAYVMKLSSDGTGIVYATYLGGDESEEATAIAVDNSGSAWVTGWVGDAGYEGRANRKYFPQTGGFTTLGLGFRDVFITRFDPRGRGLAFSIKMGGFSYDRGQAIALDGAGGAYIGGFTRSYDFPIGGAVFQPGLAGYAYNLRPQPSDGLVMKFHDDRIYRETPPDSPALLFDPSAAETPAAGDDGDPVSTFSGELYSDEAPDLDLGGSMPLTFRRRYGAALATNGPLGTNWRHNFEMSLQRTPSTVEILTWDGRRIDFNKDGTDWDQTGASDVPFQLVESSGTFELTSPSTEIRYAFDSNGKLTSITNAHGLTQTITYGPSGPSQVSDGMGRTLSLSYTGGQLSSISDGTRTVSFAHTGSLLTGATDALGRVTSYTYDAINRVPGLLTSKILPGGSAAFTQTFDAEGRVATQTSASGTVRTFSYDGLRTTVSGAGRKLVHLHNEAGQLIAAANADSSTIALLNGRVVSRAGLVSQRESNPSGRSGAVTLPSGGRAEPTYVARTAGSGTVYDLAAISFSDGTNRTMTRDSEGNITQVSDENGSLWNYTYGPHGQILSAATPLGAATGYAYNPDGTLASATDAAGNVETYGYDALKRKNRTTFGDGSIVSSTFDAAEQLSSVVDELGGTTTFGYDPNGQLTSVQSPGGGTTHYSFDTEGRMTGITDPLGHLSSFAYNAAGDLDSASDPAMSTVHYGYDAAGNRTTITDAIGSVWTSAYDDDGELISRTNPLAATTVYSEDPVQGLSSVTSPLGHTRRIKTDNFGQVQWIEDPAQNRTGFYRDSMGNLTEADLPGGEALRLTRNALGQVTTAQDMNLATWVWAYDNQGRLTTASDAVGNDTFYSYDQRNRVSRIGYASGASQDITYNAAGDVIHRAYSDGTDLSFSYDADRRRTAGNNLALGYDAAGNVISSNGITIGRDTAGRIGSVTYAVGKAVQYHYDARGLLSGVTDWLGGNTVFAYDAAGRLHTVSRPNSVVTTNSYDADDQLTGIDERGATSLASSSLTRDARGMVVAAARTLPLAPSANTLSNYAATYDNASQVVGVTHDALGRVTHDGTRTFVWDLADRLTSFTQGAATRTFVCDAIGLPVRETAGAVVRQYVWNDAFELPSLGIMRDASVDLRYYVHTPKGELIYSIEAATGARHFYHYDELGNTLFLTSDAGAVTDTYSYTPYGSVIASTGATENPFLFNGRLGVMRIGTSSLLRMRKRIYDASRFQFISRDPSGNRFSVQTIDPYLFAGANPMLFVDPLGESPEGPQSKRQAGLGVLNDLGGTLLAGVGDVAGELAAKHEDLAKGLTRANHMSQVIGGGRTQYFKAQEAMESAENYKFIESAAGAYGKITNVVSKANGVVDAATKILGSADRPEAAREVAKEYVKEYCEDKAKEAVKELVGEHVFGVLEAGAEVKAGYDEMKEITEQTKSLQNSALDTLFAQQDSILYALHHKQISPQLADQLLKSSNEAFDLSNEGATKSGLAEIGLAWERTNRHSVLKALGL